MPLYPRQLLLLLFNDLHKIFSFLKGVGRNPIEGKKKGGIKAHTIIKVPLPRATTYSQEALNCLASAAIITGRTNFTGEIELLREAIVLDPEFAMAHSNLAAYYYWTNKTGERGGTHFYCPGLAGPADRKGTLMDTGSCGRVPGEPRSICY